MSSQNCFPNEIGPHVIGIEQKDANLVSENVDAYEHPDRVQVHKYLQDNDQIRTEASLLSVLAGDLYDA